MSYPERQVESLLSLTTNYIMNNLVRYTWDFDTIKLFPLNVKATMLRKFMSSMYYWKNINFKKVFKALIVPSIDRIDLTLVKVDDEILEMLAHCHNLREVNLTRMKNKLLTPQALIKFISKLKHLTLLQMTNCEGVNDDVIVCIAENCKQLSGLDINGCIYVTDKGIQKLAILENVVWLAMSSTQVTNDGIKKLVDGASAANIKELRLADCKHTTSEILDIITEKCPSIEILVFFTLQPYENLESYFGFENPNPTHLKQLTWTVHW